MERDDLLLQVRVPLPEAPDDLDRRVDDVRTVRLRDRSRFVVGLAGRRRLGRDIRLGCLGLRSEDRQVVLQATLQAANGLMLQGRHESDLVDARLRVSAFDSDQEIILQLPEHAQQEASVVGRQAAQLQQFPTGPAVLAGQTVAVEFAEVQQHDISHCRLGRDLSFGHGVLSVRRNNLDYITIFLLVCL